METQRVFDDDALRGVSGPFTSINTQFEVCQTHSGHTFSQWPLLPRIDHVQQLSPAAPSNSPYIFSVAEQSIPQWSDPAPLSSIHHLEDPHAQQPFDKTGQVAPPGMKARVTATLWEDESSLCFQVEAKGVFVTRREDNHFINGTKLLNVAGMARGRRDGLLRIEKTRHIVKIGPMHLMGVWIPFDRALDLANKEKITHLLYPLFVHNIGGLLYNPENSRSTNTVVAATERRQTDSADSFPICQFASTPIIHHHSMQSRLDDHAHSTSPNPNTNHPRLDRAHTFPTPPTIGSGSIATSTSYKLGDQSIPSIVKGKQAGEIEQAMSNEYARSMPTTPATTPPGSFAHVVAPDPELTTDARVNSERELDLSRTVSPAPLPLTTCIPSQFSHPSTQNSARMTTTDIIRGPSNFPVLGLPSIWDRAESSPPLQSHPQGPSLVFATLSKNPSPAVSASSTLERTEDGQDPALLRVISVSCRVLLGAYLTFAAYMKLSGKTVPAESEQQAVNCSNQTKDRVGRQQPSQRTTNRRKRKQNRSRDESEDENDRVYPKRQRCDSEGPAGFDVRPLACQFNKFDNRLFGPESPDEAYHVCATCSFVSIAHLKQHLQRNHYLPRYFCFRCCRRNFSSQAMLASHQREQPTCETLNPPLYRERIGSDLIEELGLDRKNVPGTDRVDYWHKVYDTFFPGAAEIRPVSPYYEGPAAEHLH